MHDIFKLIRASLISLLFITSCGQANVREYQYIETYMKTEYTGTTPQDAKPIIVQAVSDSDAYMNAYIHFCFRKKHYQDEFQISGTIAGEPLYFRLLNENGENIASKVSFLYKDELEKEIEREINEFPPVKRKVYD